MNTTTTPTDPPKPAASRRKTAASKPRPKKAGPGASGQAKELATGEFWVLDGLSRLHG